MKELIINYEIPKGFKILKINKDRILLIKENFNLDDFIMERRSRVVDVKDFNTTAIRSGDYLLVVSENIPTKYLYPSLVKGDICEVRWLGNPPSSGFSIKEHDKVKGFLFYPEETDGKYLILTDDELEYLLNNDLKIITT